MTQPVPTQQPAAQPDYQSQHNMMTPPQPVINTGPQQPQPQQQMNVANNGMMMMQEPMAANEGFGAFSSF